MVQFTLNGVVFVLLGEQLPTIVRSATKIVQSGGQPELWWLGVWVLAIVGALLALRAAWAWTSLQIVLFKFRNHATIRHLPRRTVAAVSVADARGAITLAGVMTLPLSLAGGGAPFPTRDLAIFLAAGAIFLSILIASIGLLLLARGMKMPELDEPQFDEADARLAAAQGAPNSVP